MQERQGNGKADCLVHATDPFLATGQQQQMLPSSPASPPSQQHSPHAAAPSFPAATSDIYDDMAAGSFNDAAAGWEAAAGHRSTPAGTFFAEGLAGSLAGTGLPAAASAIVASMGPNAGAAAAAAAAQAAQDAGPAVLAGSQVLRSSTAKHGSSSWVATSCLVPEGLPTAAAAEAGGGLACMEVVCWVLVLQDCRPAAASPGLVKALSKVKWQEFGLSFTDFTASSSAEDPTGILTLGVLPHAVVVPLTMVVFSTNSISSTSSGTSSTDVAAADAAGAAGATAPGTAAGANPTGKRQRGGSSAPQALPALSCKREMLLFTGALEDALLALKARLPAGYFQGKLEACVTGCLPPISTSLANILTRAANPLLMQQACQLLSCESQQLQEALLSKLQEAAITDLAAKAAVGSSRLQKQLQQQHRSCSRSGSRAKAAAQAAAAVAAGAGDGTGHPDAEEEDGGAEQQRQQEPQQQLHQWQMQMRGSTAGSGDGQDDKMDGGLQPPQPLPGQQQLQMPTWPAHRPTSSAAPQQGMQPQQQQPQPQQQHMSLLTLPHPAAAPWPGGFGSRKRGRRVAVLDGLHDADEQHHAEAAKGGEVLGCQEQAQLAYKEQQAAEWRRSQEAGCCSSLDGQAAAEQPGQWQHSSLNGCQLISSSAEAAGGAVDFTDGSHAAVAASGSPLPNSAAAVPLQLGEAAEHAGTHPVQLRVGAVVSDAEAAGSQPAAAALGRWRQRKQLPAGRKRFSGSAAASLF
ncbi:hypothetical protein COO60DRAFT_269636 [Scenedesmus sp. NREL 46B-D3]|nr:hypothetical protein COO60DRAFT_269636 [Scenedesmus sp. NREL 46B-D3]